MFYELSLLFENPLKQLTTKENQKFVEILLSKGAQPEKVSEILKKFFDFTVILRHLDKNATNSEWVKFRSWQKKIDNQYNKAIQSLEKLISDNSIPLTIKEKSIKKDIQILKNRKDYLTSHALTIPTIEPSPVSIQQMLIFQSKALFEYLKQFNSGESDTRLYEFIAELFQNLYKDSVLRDYTKGLDGITLKKNFIDNADKLRTKYNKLEKRIEPFLK
jgi:hypothetical protein